MTYRLVVPSLALTLLLLPGVARAAVTNYQVTLSGDQETPPVATAATGTGTLQHDDTTNILSGTVTFSGLSGAANGAHVHKGAACVTGAVLEGMSTTSPISVNVPVQGADLAELVAGRLYMNIHTGTNPNGEIRGQILPVGQSPTSCAADAGADAAPVDPPKGDGGNGATTERADSGATAPAAPADDGGCSTSGGATPAGAIALGVLGFALVARARRRRG